MCNFFLYPFRLRTCSSAHGVSLSCVILGVLPPKHITLTTLGLLLNAASLKTRYVQFPERFPMDIKVPLMILIEICHLTFQIAKNTTPMYRAPEMLDLYQNYPINELSDVWVRFFLDFFHGLLQSLFSMRFKQFCSQALGCILYLLCFNEHPFEDSAKLRIINANYCIPPSDTDYTVFHDLISEYSLWRVTH